jgi:hypothetical protein
MAHRRAETASEFSINIACVGDRGVGKRTLLQREEGTATQSGMPYDVRYIMIDDDFGKVVLWCHDGLSSQRKERHFITHKVVQFVRAHAIMLMYDVSDKTSFLNIPKHYEMLTDYARPDVYYILVGNKIDFDARRVR